MESEILLKRSRKTVRNSAMPDFVVLDDFDPVCPAKWLSSRMTTFRDEGTADSITDTASTIEMSSSSVTLDSFAASSSSRAMLNETEKRRSPPSDPKAPVVAIYNSSFYKATLLTVFVL